MVAARLDCDGVDCARHARGQPGFPKREQHQVDSRRDDTEVSLHVGLGRRTAVVRCVGVNDGEMLAMPGPDIRSEIVVIPDNCCCRRQGKTVNVRYRVVQSEARCTGLRALLTGGT